MQPQYAVYYWHTPATNLNPRAHPITLLDSQLQHTGSAHICTLMQYKIFGLRACQQRRKCRRRAAGGWVFCYTNQGSKHTRVQYARTLLAIHHERETLRLSLIHI